MKPIKKIGNPQLKSGDLTSSHITFMRVMYTLANVISLQDQAESKVGKFLKKL